MTSIFRSTNLLAWFSSGLSVGQAKEALWKETTSPGVKFSVLSGVSTYFWMRSRLIFASVYILQESCQSALFASSMQIDTYTIKCGSIENTISIEPNTFKVVNATDGVNPS